MPGDDDLDELIETFDEAIKDQPWRPFVIDNNSYGFTSNGIKTPEEWVEYVRAAEKLHAEFPGTTTSRKDGTVLSGLLEQKAVPGRVNEQVDDLGIRDDMPSFGYRIEHTSEVTLEAWGNEHGMNLRAIVEASTAQV